MKEWKRFFVLWPRRIGGEWRWLSYAEYAWVCGGGGLGGDHWKEYK